MLPIDQQLRSRAQTAIGRVSLSRPLQCAIADGLITKDTPIFDYGCGRGDDIRHLAAMGYRASGWDPAYSPSTERYPSSVINLGYVVNVIENARERRDALRQAWALAEDVLIVSARLALEGRALRNRSPFEDGCLTSCGTFQKFFDQQELRHWIEQSLKEPAVPAAPGIFYVFRSEQTRSSFVASRYRHRTSAPRLTKSAEMFTLHQELLRPLMTFVTNRARLPFEDELAEATSIIDVFGSLRRAFRVIRTVTEHERWDQISLERSEDLLVYLALQQFDERIPFNRLPLVLRRDVKALFGTYKRACVKADQLLFSLGQPGIVNLACGQSAIGKLTPSALYVHESALSALSPILRLYEGCARGYLGRIEEANILKLHTSEPRISYLSYPDFDNDPHPVLASSLTVHLQTFRVKVRNYLSSDNRPILHRKELFVSPDHRAHRKFARLTAIEECKGLYRDTRRIGLERGWNEVLVQKGLYFKGHRLLNASVNLGRESRLQRTTSPESAP